MEFSRRVFVRDSDGRELRYLHPGKAKILLEEGNATVFARYRGKIDEIRLASAQVASTSDLLDVRPGSFGIAQISFSHGRYFQHREVLDKVSRGVAG